MGLASIEISLYKSGLMYSLLFSNTLEMLQTNNAEIDLYLNKSKPVLYFATTMISVSCHVVLKYVYTKDY